MNTKEELMDKLNEWEKQAKQYEKELETLSLKNSNQGDLERKIDELKSKLYAVYEAKKQINISLSLYSSRLVCSNGIIDLYKKDHYMEGHYDICLHGTITRIGYIYVQPLGISRNNIAYEIDDKYRGKNYATQALVLLTDYLCENGVENIEIFARNDNKPSIRVMEKFNEIMPALEIKNDGYETIYYFKINKKSPKNK